MTKGVKQSLKETLKKFLKGKLLGEGTDEWRNDSTGVKTAE